MLDKRCGLSIAVVRNIPNIVDYLYPCRQNLCAVSENINGALATPTVNEEESEIGDDAFDLEWE